MASPAFWDDNRRAQELIRERAELARVVAGVTELDGQASDLAVLLELAGEAGDDSVDAEIREGIARLQRELDEFGLKVKVSGRRAGTAAAISSTQDVGGPEPQHRHETPI